MKHLYVSFFVLVYNCFWWVVSVAECSLCFYLVVRPLGYVDGHPAKMSRGYILYLKGLCLGSSHCFSFLLLQPLFVGGCILVTWNMHVLICPGLCWYNECALI
jgi:hypothetical protein